MKSSTYVSVRFDRFVLVSTRRSIRLRQSSRTAKVRQRFRRRTSSCAESNAYITLIYFFNLTALMIGCIVSCDTWRELTEAWWSLTAFSKWRFNLKHAETAPPAQNARLPTCVNTIHIFIHYLYLNMIAISLNMNGPQQKKLIRLGAYKCSVNTQTSDYWNEMEWKKGIVLYTPLSVHFHIFKRRKLYVFTSKIRFGTCSSSTSESTVQLNHFGRPKQVLSSADEKFDVWTRP